MALTSTSSSSSRSSSILDDPSNPLYLHHEESPGAMLVYQPLVGENYPTWAKLMRMALIAKNKLGFIDGTLTLSSPMVKTSSAIQAWIHCNKMVASWILNSVSQEISTSIVCKDTALEIWNDLRERLSQANGPRVFQLQKDIAFTNNETHLTNNVIQRAVHSTSMAEFVANNSELGSPTISEERIPSLVEYSFTPSAKLESVRSVLNGTNPIPANNTYTDANGARSQSISLLFPPAMSEIETDDSCSESNEAPHAAAQFSNSVLNGTNPIPTNNSDTDANGARSLSISLLFPPAMSEIGTDDSCSESNETPRAAVQFSYSISSCFPPGRSETDSSSEIYELVPTYPSSTASPGRTATFKEILKPKSSNNSKANRKPPKFSHSKKNSILSTGRAKMSDTIKHVAGQIIMYKSQLKRLESTLDGVAPVVQEIKELSQDLHFPEKETQSLIEQLEKGKELVLKCSKIKRRNWNYCVKAYSYSNKLSKLNRAIEQFFQVNWMVQNTRLGLETLALVSQNTEIGLKILTGVNQNTSVGLDTLAEVNHNTMIGLETLADVNYTTRIGLETLAEVNENRRTLNRLLKHVEGLDLDIKTKYGTFSCAVPKLRDPIGE